MIRQEVYILFLNRINQALNQVLSSDYVDFPITQKVDLGTHISEPTIIKNKDVTNEVKNILRFFVKRICHLPLYGVYPISTSMEQAVFAVRNYVSHIKHDLRVGVDLSGVDRQLLFDETIVKEVLTSLFQTRDVEKMLLSLLSQKLSLNTTRFNYDYGNSDVYQALLSTLLVQVVEIPEVVCLVEGIVSHVGALTQELNEVIQDLGSDFNRVTLSEREVAQWTMDELARIFAISKKGSDFHTKA